MTTMDKEKIKSVWRKASNEYYVKNSKNINLWKSIQYHAKKRGIEVPKLSDGDLIKNTPMELLQKLQLPLDLISEEALLNYNRVKQSPKIDTIKKQCTCGPESYICACEALAIYICAACHFIGVSGF